MANFRTVNTRFWSDAFVAQLNPLDRYLFLYFITNVHTKICGIYELPMKYIAIETGLDQEMVIKMLRRLKGKVHYVDGWVWVANFVKHQSSGSDTVKTAINEQIEKVPLKIREKVSKLAQLNRVSIGYGWGIDTATTITHTNTNTNTNADEDVKTAFDEFWSNYPKRELKKKARDVWERKKLDSNLTEILEFIEKAKTTDRWKKGYIKQPPAFLSGECWTDDLTNYQDYKDKSSGSTVLPQ